MKLRKNMKLKYLIKYNKQIKATGITVAAFICACRFDF